MQRPHVATILRVGTLSLLTFVAFGASWQLASAAASEGRAAASAQPRVVTTARGGLLPSTSFDTRFIRETVSGVALVLGGGIPVTVADTAETRHLRAPRGATVADVVALSGLAVGPLDQTIPADPAQPVNAGDVVRVVRVSEATVVVQEAVPFPVQKVADATLPSGRVVVSKAGTPGTAENTYTVRTADGAETGRTLVATVQLVAPDAEVQRVGTATFAPVAPGDIQGIIVAAAQRWGADSSQLLRVAYCESHYNPNAYNASSGASGLFQFLASTWAANSVRAGYGGASVFDAVANANTAAMMFANGQSGQWSCK